MGLRHRLFRGERKRFAIEDSSVAVVRDSEKCILCGRCVRVCAETQGVYNLSQQGRGFRTVVTPAHGVNMDDSVCIQCGQCINVCPVAAFLEKKDTERVFEALNDPTLHVVAQCAPSIRSAIGEGFGLPPGTPAEGKMVAALRKLGFAAVFNTDLGADMCITEESNELLERLEGKGPLPMFTSCSPGWINYLEKFYPQLIPHASTVRSPMSILSVLAKTHYAQKAGIDPRKIYMVAVMPCTAKKYEAHRRELRTDYDAPYTDAVITTRELIFMIKSYGILFNDLADEQFDSPLGNSTGAGDIFGITGGVMEATLRTAEARLSGGKGGKLEFPEVRGVGGVREVSVQLAGKKLEVAVCNGMGNARTILDRVARKESQYHVVEVMACLGGCSGGGGQPYGPPDMKILDPRQHHLRGVALYGIDRDKPVRRSHENPAVKAIYEEFLGQPGSEKARELLHTSYQARLPRGIP
jgi:iron-only hydrogenase group A